MMLDRSIKASTRLAAAHGETRVAGAEPFIQQQNFRIDGCRDSKAKPHQHAG